MCILLFLFSAAAGPRNRPGVNENETLCLCNTDELVKSLKTVMLDLIQHPEAFEITGFLLSQE